MGPGLPPRGSGWPFQADLPAPALQVTGAQGHPPASTADPKAGPSPNPPHPPTGKRRHAHLATCPRPDPWPWPGPLGASVSPTTRTAARLGAGGGPGSVNLLSRGPWRRLCPTMRRLLGPAREPGPAGASGHGHGGHGAGGAGKAAWGCGGRRGAGGAGAESAPTPPTPPAPSLADPPRSTARPRSDPHTGPDECPALGREQKAGSRRPGRAGERLSEEAAA